MEIIIGIIIIIGIYSLTYLESIFWHWNAIVEEIKEAKTDNVNKHIPMVLIRIVICLLGLLISIWYTVAIGLIVVGIHPSILYYYRNKWNSNIYKEGIWSNPSSSNKTSKINFKLMYRIIFIVLGIIVLTISSLKAQDSIPDFANMSRSQIRQYRLLVESGYKKQLNQERQYYAYEINKAKYDIKKLKELNEFKIDSMIKYRKLERLNYNKQLNILKQESKQQKDSIKLITNYYIKNQKITVRLKKQNTRYLYSIVILVVVLIATTIYIINKLKK